MAHLKKTVIFGVLAVLVMGTIAIAQINRSGSQCEKHEDYGNYLFGQGLRGVPFDGYTELQIAEFKKKISALAEEKLSGFVNPNDYHEIRSDATGNYYFGIHGLVDGLEYDGVNRPNAGCIMPIAAPQG